MRGTVLAAGAALGIAIVAAAAQTAVTGSPDVLINGRPALRLGDRIEGCGTAAGAGPKTLATGSPNVFINGRPAVRAGDAAGCDGSPKPASPNVRIDGR